MGGRSAIGLSVPVFCFVQGVARLTENARGVGTSLESGLLNLGSTCSSMVLPFLSVTVLVEGDHGA